MVMSSQILRRVLSYGIYFGLLLLSSQGFGLSYFSKEIDYWKEKKTEETTTKKAEKTNGFPWKKYLDPKHDEFFQEGNHKPPKPFMELARNPSDQNIKNWFAVIEKKNELMQKLQLNLAAYLKKHAKKAKPKEKALVKKQIAIIQAERKDYKRFRFRLYFESKCPHCERMMKSMSQIQRKGYFVEVRQVDIEKPKFSIPFPLQRATKEELKSKKIKAWPVLFVADTQKKKLFRINGYHSSESILQTILKK